MKIQKKEKHFLGGGVVGGVGVGGGVRVDVNEEVFVKIQKKWGVWGVGGRKGSGWGGCE